MRKNRQGQQLKNPFFTYCVIRSINYPRNIFIIVERNVTQSSLFIILQVHSTCPGCQPHPLSKAHKTVTTVACTGHIFCAATSLQRCRKVAPQKNMTSTGGCSYSFVYS